jgi:hypothetical protein
MMHPNPAKRKYRGPVQKLKRIRRRLARIQAESIALDGRPHPHLPQRRGVASVLQQECPRDCPVEARRSDLAKRLNFLAQIRRELLEEIARLEENRGRRSSITVEKYLAAKAVARTKKELRRLLGAVGRSTLDDWERQHPDLK